MFFFDEAIKYPLKSDNVTEDSPVQKGESPGLQIQRCGFPRGLFNLLQFQCLI